LVHQRQQMLRHNRKAYAPHLLLLQPGTSASLIVLLSLLLDRVILIVSSSCGRRIIFIRINLFFAAGKDETLLQGWRGNPAQQHNVLRSQHHY
jgi:hypothetical protein